MDTRTGEIFTVDEEEVAALAAAVNNGQLLSPAAAAARANRGAIGKRTYIVAIGPAILTPRARVQLERTGRTTVSRNSACPCGSRKRFKKCCMTAE